MHSLHPAADMLPHQTAPTARTVLKLTLDDLVPYIRDMFTGAIGDHTLPFASREEAERVIVASLVQRFGRAFTETDRSRVCLYVAGHWSMVQLEEMAYSEAALLADAKRMYGGENITTLLDFVADHWYARTRDAVVRRRVGDRHWTPFCAAEAWPWGHNAHNIVRRELAAARERMAS